MTRPLAALVLLLALTVLMAGCGGEPDQAKAPSTPKRATAAAPTGTPSGKTIHVPRDASTIQQAVDRARDGDLILIAAGSYRESVVIPKGRARLVLRGEDRNRVILDGAHARLDGIVIHGDAVAVENMTLQRYKANGVVWVPDPREPTDLIQGYRASYLTTSGNGLYGVYALSAQWGEVDHVYATGSPDSGIYIGQCRACHAVVHQSTAVRNMVGFEDTNASGVVFADNTARANRVGFALNSQRRERYAPAVGSWIVQNRIDGTGAASAPRGSEAFGVGIDVSGSTDNVVRRNTVTGTPTAAVVLEPSVDGYPQLTNTVDGLQAAGTPVAVAELGTPGRLCLRRLTGVRTTVPADRAARSCTATTVPRTASPAALRRATAGRVNYRDVALAPAQPNMPAATTAPARPAVNLPSAALWKRWTGVSPGTTP